jgi:hypothetical protein
MDIKEVGRGLYGCEVSDPGELRASCYEGRQEFHRLLAPKAEKRLGGGVDRSDGWSPHVGHCIRCSRARGTSRRKKREGEVESGLAVEWGFGPGRGIRLKRR